MAAGGTHHARQLHPLMKKMLLYFLILAGCLSVCGYLARRHHARAALGSPSVEMKGQRSMSDWQRGISIDTRTDYTSGSKAGSQLRERLRQEELRQKPEESRN